MRFRGRAFGLGYLLVTAVAVACGRDLPIGDAPPEAPDGAVVDDGGALLDAPPGLTIDAGNEAGPNDRLVFLSDTLFLPANGGIPEANRICQADYAKCTNCPPGARTFVAWISVNKDDAIDRVKGRRFATPNAAASSGWALAVYDEKPPFPGSLRVPIGRLSGNDAGGLVWTGTGPDGRYVMGQTCGDAFLADGGAGYVGTIHATSDEWTQASYPPRVCTDPYPVYCFQDSP